MNLDAAPCRMNLVEQIEDRRVWSVSIAGWVRAGERSVFGDSRFEFLVD